MVFEIILFLSLESYVEEIIATPVSSQLVSMPNILISE